MPLLHSTLHHLYALLETSHDVHLKAQELEVKRNVERQNAYMKALEEEVAARQSFKSDL